MKTPKLTWKTLINLSFLLLIIVFSLVLAIGLNAYVRSYNLLDAEKTRATVLAKTAEKGLFRPPAYYVKVDWNEKSGDLHEGVLNRISSRQMKNIEVGDEISGYLVSENHFITLLDLATDGLLLFFFLVFLFLMVIALVSAWVGNMFSAAKKQNKKKRKRKKGKKKSTKRRQNEEKCFGIGFYLFVVFFVIVGFFSVTALWNGMQKVSPVGKVETEAVIVDKYAERQWQTTYHFNPLYQLTLQFTDHEGNEYQMKKEVTPNTYNKYSISDTILISYKNDDPFDIFIEDMTWKDMYQAYIYWELSLYIIFVATVILVIVFGLKRIFNREKRR